MPINKFDINSIVTNTVKETNFSGVILIEDALLTPHICEEKDENYGYGVWIRKKNNEVFKYHVMGYDPGVSFHSSFYPKSEVKMVIVSNKAYGPYKLTKVIEEEI
ncbi:hypothetical protein [Chengkuizengella axinellae]|uniref:Uncharacterized protein n=1 Tax=Chengkuizengella axinellae TaxID=3064388 RepID=A0ABT9J255_9BACL|nr:hypothetical protein [Chengkuizengella sp. 2205SS18-9]MDP5275689.1 hypothetical protein [Chengkuizengella sp. 2205SS18-9]